MMRVKLRTKDPGINIVTRSGIATGEDISEYKRIVNDVWVWRYPKKKEGFNLLWEKETFVEEKKDFMDPSTSEVASKIAMDTNEGAEPVEMKLLLQACINIFHNKNVIENLQDLINSCMKNNKPRWSKRLLIISKRVREELTERCP